ncbi:hypothetical protein HaLaN_18806, partial [Haematococcus lacustris]
MPPKKRPCAAEQEPLPIESPRKQGPSTPPGKQREERRAEWKTVYRNRVSIHGYSIRAGGRSNQRASRQTG